MLLDPGSPRLYLDLYAWYIHGETIGGYLEHDCTRNSVAPDPWSYAIPFPVFICLQDLSYELSCLEPHHGLTLLFVFGLLATSVEPDLSFL